jgi:Mg-chelatase subunit ChlD
MRGGGDEVPAAPQPPRVLAVTVALPASDAGGEPAPSLHDRLAERLHVEPDGLSGWLVASSLSRTGFDAGNRELREYARKLAADAVLRRAAQLVGPIRRATRPVLAVMDEPYRGELDVDGTLENVVGKPHPERDDWVVELREDREQQVVLMLDTSLSMAGENLAIAAVAAAVLALKMRGEDLSVVCFESTAAALSHLEEPDAPEAVVEKILGQPARGYTNIEDALRVGSREVSRGRNPRRAGLLITDGVWTAGGDPTHLAAEFPRLFVLLTEDYKMDEELCRKLAAIGRGDVFRVKHHSQLPTRMLEIANRVLR